MKKAGLKKIVSLLAISAMCIAMLAGCSGGDASTAASSAPAADSTPASAAGSTSGSEATASTGGSGEVRKVGLLTYSLGEEFGVDTLTGAENAASTRNMEIIAPDPAGDLQKQIAQLEDMIQQDLDAICIAPVDGYAIVPYLQQVLDAGIPVINYDIIADMEGCNATILADNIEGGREAARVMAEAVGETGKVLVLEDNPGVIVIEERCQGFMDEMAENYPDIEVVTQVSNGTRDTHQKTTENMLTAHPDLVGIFAPDGDHTLGAYAACTQMGMTDVRVMGYDASPEQITIMEDDGPDGVLLGSIAQFPIMLGRVVIETADRVLAGEEITEDIMVETGVARADDIANFEFLE